MALVGTIICSNSITQAELEQLVQFNYVSYDMETLSYINLSQRKSKIIQLPRLIFSIINFRQKNCLSM